MLARGALDFKEALSIKGKLQFAEGQLFHRVAAAVCRLLSCWASTGGVRPLTEEMRTALGSLDKALNAAGGRSVQPRSFLPPIIIFTDGACEPHGTMVGGILLVLGMRTQAFGAKLSDIAVRRLTSKKDQKQVIGQAEILPIVVAKTVWKEQIRDRKVIYFIDNDSARMALIKG